MKFKPIQTAVGALEVVDQCIFMSFQAREMRQKIQDDHHRQKIGASRLIQNAYGAMAPAYPKPKCSSVSIRCHETAFSSWTLRCQIE
jgi:hypothetical protein